MSSTVHHPSIHPPDSQELNASSGEDLVPLKEVMGLLEVRKEISNQKIYGFNKL